MATQQAYVQAKGDISSLLQDNYKGKVKPWVKFMSPITAMMQDVGPGEYTLDGKKLIFAADTDFAQGALGTPGWLPASTYFDPINLETTAARIYVRRAVDNFIAAIGNGPNAFEGFLGRLMRQAWEALERAQCRHAHGSSAATIAKVASRTNNTTLVLQDGYGYTGTNPGLHIGKGAYMAVLDSSNAFAVLGAGEVTSYTGSTKTVVFDRAIDDGVTVAAAGDLIVFATAPSTSESYFATERGYAPLGLLDWIDPAASQTSYLTVSESSQPRVKPTRRASASFGEVELMEFLAEIAAKGTTSVTPESHKLVCNEGIVIELAKALVTSTQIMQKGGELPGGWSTVSIAGHEFVKDPYAVHNVLYALCLEDLKSVDLDGDAHVFSEDGSQWSRIADFDGKELFIAHYKQTFMDQRNRSGVLTGISNANADRYIPVV